MSEQTTTSLIVPSLPPGAAVSIDPQAIERIQALVERSARGTRITSAESATRAAGLLRQLQNELAGIEEARKTAKGPFYDLCKRIDEVARDLSSGLAAEKQRIAALLGTWEAEARRQTEEARRRAAEAAEKVRREAEAKAREAEAKARADIAKAEAEAKAATDAKARAEAEERALAAKADADAKAKAAAEQEAKEIAAAINQNSPAVARTAGTSVRKNLKFKVTNVFELYQQAPDLCIIQPNNPAIRAALKQLPEGATLAGIEYWYETAASLR